ncbi:hypothetical protein EDC01DRAFT_103259 [Geopyxis carbonaria]|nr:hypothetical protein EDC01DRAFT_103259 [Geopyxis carbonaria]
MLHWYRASLVKKPLLTQCVVTAILFGSGDAIAQHAVERRGIRNHDFGRTFRMGFYGGCIFGPAAVQWYKVLEKYVKAPQPLVQAGLRVAADQLVFAPINMGVFFTVITTLEGGDLKKKLDDSYWKGLKANWMLWPAVQTVNFTMVPLQHRVLVVNLVSLGWNSYLSFINTQKTPGTPHAVKMVDKMEVA